jgi:hypothetical protein
VIYGRHLVDKQAEGGRLDRQAGYRLAGIIEGMEIVFAIFKLHFCHDKQQNRRGARPALVPFIEAGKGGVILRLILLAHGNDEAPRLAVVGGVRPACGFQHGAQGFRRHGAVGKGARAPTVAQLV